MSFSSDQLIAISTDSWMLLVLPKGVRELSVCVRECRCVSIAPPLALSSVRGKVHRYALVLFLIAQLELNCFSISSPKTSNSAISLRRATLSYLKPGLSSRNFCDNLLPCKITVAYTVECSAINHNDIVLINHDANTMMQISNHLAVLATPLPWLVHTNCI